MKKYVETGRGGIGETLRAESWLRGLSGRVAKAPFTPSTNTVSLALRAWRLVSSDLESPLTLKLGLRDPEQVGIRCVLFTRDLS